VRFMRASASSPTLRSGGQGAERRVEKKPEPKTAFGVKVVDDTTRGDIDTVDRFLQEHGVLALGNDGGHNVVLLGSSAGSGPSAAPKASKPARHAEKVDAATKVQSGLRGQAARRQAKDAQAERTVAVIREREELAQMIFCRHDVDESGYLSLKEMTYALREMVEAAGAKVRLDVDTVEAKFDEADTDGNGRVDYDEFCAVYNDLVGWASWFASANGAPVSTRNVSYDVNPTELTAEETALVMEMLDFEDTSGVRTKGFSKQTEVKKKKLRSKREEMEASLVASAEKSLAKVNELRHRRARKWPDVARRKLSDIYMVAACGDKLGAGEIVGPGRRKSVSHGAGDVANMHIDTAKLDFGGFSRLLVQLLGPGAAFLAEHLWADAIEGDADGLLTFQEVLKFFAPIHSPDADVRAAFMFDLYDKDDSGAITLKELAILIQNSAPGSLVEHDLLSFARLSLNVVGEGDTSGCPQGARKTCFFFDDYLTVGRAQSDSSVIAVCRKMLGIEATS